MGKENTQCSNTGEVVQPDNTMTSGILGGLSMMDHIQEETYRSQLANLDQEVDLENGAFTPNSVSTPLSKEAVTEKGLDDDTVVEKCPELSAIQEDDDFHGYTNEVC